MSKSFVAANAMLASDPHLYAVVAEPTPPPSPSAGRVSEAEPMPLDEIAALVSSSRNAAATSSATTKESKPKLTVSASGRFQDQFYHTQEASRAMGVLKSRAMVKQTGDAQRTDGLAPKRKKSMNVNGRDVEQFSDADIVYAGYLIKQGSFWKTWRRRYFILRRDVNVLAYYTSQENLVKLGEIVIDASTKVTAPNAKDKAFPGRFLVEHSVRKLVLVAEDGRSAAETWTLVINRCIGLRVTEAASVAAAASRGSLDRESLRSSLLQMRLSGNGSQLVQQHARSSGNGSQLMAKADEPQPKQLSKGIVASAASTTATTKVSESPSTMTEPPPAVATTVAIPLLPEALEANPLFSKVKRHSTDSRAIQAAADEAAIARIKGVDDLERDRIIRSARLRSIDSANDSARKLKLTDTKPVATVSSRGVSRPLPSSKPSGRLFRSYSAGSVLSTRSLGFDNIRASHDDNGLRTSLTLTRSAHPDSNKHLRCNDAELDDNDPTNPKAHSRARNLSLPGFRPVPSVELSISVGCQGTQDVSHMLVVLSSILPEERGDAKELARTEVQGSLALRSCGGDFFVRDFSALLPVPLNGARNVMLQFEIFSVVNLGTETLSSQQSLGFVRIPHVDLLFSGDSTLVLECLRTRSSPSKQVHFLVIDRIRPSESLNIGHSYTYAKRHFVADIVPFDLRNGSSTSEIFSPTTTTSTSPTTSTDSIDKNSTGSSPTRAASASSISRASSSLSYGDMMRGNLDSSDATQVFISEELSSSYCSVSVAAKYMNLVQQRNKRRIHDAKLLIDDVEYKYEHMPSSPNSRTENADIISLHIEMLRDAEARTDYYNKLYEAYVGCEDYYEVLLAMLEEGKEPGITGCLKRSTQKKDKRTEFMPTNLNCHIVRARRVALSSPATASNSGKDQGTTREVKTTGAKGDELVYAVVTHGCPAAHCLGFKDGGLRRLKQTIAQATKDDIRSVERIEQRQDVVRCQILAIASAAFLTVVGLAANQSARHQERLQLMCQTGFLINMESLLSTIKNERGMIEDMSEGIEWLNSSVSLHVIQSMEVDPKLKSAKCTGISSSENGEDVVATFALPSDVFATLPSVLREGNALKVHALLFTQGINEMQSVANTVLDTSLQDEINHESVTRLLRFFQVYKTHVLAMQPPNLERINDLPDLEIEIKILAEKLSLARKSHVQKKNVNILIESSDLCRRLGAGRTTCCKSGKDRTAMSVTLECSRLLVDKFHVKQGVHLCNAMRERGVRRVNVLANTGKNKFAFNTFQLKYLPDCYRPPVLSADSKVQS